VSGTNFIITMLLLVVALELFLGNVPLVEKIRAAAAGR
jgi:hypothetical protein